MVGTAVAVRAPEPVLTELRAALTDLSPATGPIRNLVVEEDADGRFRLIDTETLVRSGIEASVAAATVVWRLNAIAARTDRHLVIHAGCVADEGAVLLPGRSGTGKSTLVAACITAGLAYLSDEYAVVDLGDGSIVPYAKPLALDGEQLVAASHLRANSVGTPVPPSGIVFPRYSPDEPTAATALAPGWTLLALAAHTTNLATIGGAALPWLAGLAASCPAWQVTYGEAVEAVPNVRELAVAWADTVRADAVRAAEVLGPVTPHTTTVTLGDELAVFEARSGTVHLLNAAAAFVWTCVPDAPHPADLRQTVLTRAPAGALDPQTIDATIAHLVDIGLLGDVATDP